MAVIERRWPDGRRTEAPVDPAGLEQQRLRFGAEQHLAPRRVANLALERSQQRGHVDAVSHAEAEQLDLWPGRYPKRLDPCERLRTALDQPLGECRVAVRDRLPNRVNGRRAPQELGRDRRTSRARGLLDNRDPSARLRRACCGGETRHATADERASRDVRIHRNDYKESESGATPRGSRRSERKPSDSVIHYEDRAFIV